MTTNFFFLLIVFLQNTYLSTKKKENQQHYHHKKNKSKNHRNHRLSNQPTHTSEKHLYMNAAKDTYLPLNMNNIIDEIILRTKQYTQQHAQNNIYTISNNNYNTDITYLQTLSQIIIMASNITLLNQHNIFIDSDSNDIVNSSNNNKTSSTLKNNNNISKNIIIIKKNIEYFLELLTRLCIQSISNKNKNKEDQLNLNQPLINHSALFITICKENHFVKNKTELTVAHYLLFNIINNKEYITTLIKNIDAAKLLNTILTFSQSPIINEKINTHNEQSIIQESVYQKALLTDFNKLLHLIGISKHKSNQSMFSSPNIILVGSLIATTIATCLAINNTSHNNMIKHNIDNISDKNNTNKHKTNNQIESKENIETTAQDKNIALRTKENITTSEKNEVSKQNNTKTQEDEDNEENNNQLALTSITTAASAGIIGNKIYTDRNKHKRNSAEQTNNNTSNESNESLNNEKTQQNIQNIQNILNILKDNEPLDTTMRYEFYSLQRKFKNIQNDANLTQENKEEEYKNIINKLKKIIDTDLAYSENHEIKDLIQDMPYMTNQLPILIPSTPRYAIPGYSYSISPKLRALITKALH